MRPLLRFDCIFSFLGVSLSPFAITEQDLKVEKIDTKKSCPARHNANLRPSFVEQTYKFG
jgi:hypothetical protein